MNKTEWESQLRDDLRSLEDGTDSKDIFQLAQARNDALRGRGATRRRLIWPTAAVTAASVLLAVFVATPWQTTEQPIPVANEKLIFGDNMDLYEDLDFYYWLSKAEDTTAG